MSQLMNYSLIAVIFLSSVLPSLGQSDGKKSYDPWKGYLSSKTLKKDGFQSEKYDYSLTAQVDYFNSLLQAQDDDGQHLFIVSHAIAKGDSYQTTRQRAILSAMNDLNLKTEFGRTDIENSTQIQNTKRVKVLKRAGLLKSATTIASQIEIEGIRRRSELLYENIGFPMLGIKRIVHLYRITSDNQFEFLSGIALEREWVSNQKLIFTN